MSLKGHVAIVTGASRGIGRAIARGFANEGSDVVLLSRHKESLDAVVTEMSQVGLSATPIAADVTTESQMQQVVAKVVEKFGRVDTLVNNAGIGFFKKVLQMETSEFDAMWNVNVRGVFVATKSVLPHMVKARSGNIVNIASLAGKNTFVGGAGYAATKWALRGFAGSLMLEVREYGIRVITVFPGSVDTSFSSEHKRGDRITQPEDVADAVLFAVTAPARSMFSEIDVRPTNPK